MIDSRNISAVIQPLSIIMIYHKHNNNKYNKRNNNKYNITVILNFVQKL